MYSLIVIIVFHTQNLYAPINIGNVFYLCKGFEIQAAERTLKYRNTIQ